MDERGLWKLFYETGLPEVWLCIAGTRQASPQAGEEPARTAFRGEREPAREV